MDDSLPKDVDVVVLGTGLQESILASACSRAGLSVLHLDRNEFYGGDWSAFTFRSIEEWFQVQNKVGSSSSDEDLTSFVNEEGEQIVRLGDNITIDNLEHGWQQASSTVTSTTVKQETVEMSLREQVEKDWRKFSIDMVPKALLARGPMVQTLCDSEVSKYAEFKCIDRFLCFENTPEGPSYSRVPCSKGDIFQDTKLSLIDKRKLMKFLTFCLQWNTKADEMNEWKEYADKPFSEFLESMTISGNLQHYITDSIGILHPNATCKEGLSAVCRFVDSVGRFGSSPFLSPLYGCGELTQCFCRLCAVFGGLYCLGRPIQGLIQKDNKVTAVIADNQRVNCKVIVCSPRFVPPSWSNNQSDDKWLQRSIHITNKSILSEDKEHISLVNLSQLNPQSAVRLFESGFEVCCAPKGFNLVHLTGKGSSEDLKEVEKAIFFESGPQPIWSVRFSILTSRSHDKTPENAVLVNGPDHSLDYSSVIQETQSLFNKFWPDLDFLPRALSKEEEPSEVPDIPQEEDIPQQSTTTS